ncbi:glycosyltransferase family 2 protein [Flavobacterium plurextorum]|uniref:glycosyltransferase family 2 protein n=1 Tax=Flavobacterium plurextorum TaxID=1114867 RepID=UPI0037564090
MAGGLRNNGGNKYSTNNNPLLTIITVVRNGEEIIEETIESVLKQEYNNIEYIIIDGGSTDNTIERIKKYENSIDLWISEPDKGIYDAMNKGISLATGEFINFMNAGDSFCNSNVCNLVVNNLLTNDCDVIYGDFIAINKNNSILIKAKDISKIYHGSLFSHQSCFVKSKVLKENLFDLKYRIASDYNQFLILFLKNKSFYYLPIPFSIMLIDGVSYSNVKTYVEQIKILHSHKPFSLCILNYVPLILIAYVRKIMGAKFTAFFRKLKWQVLNQYSNK